MPAEPSVPDCTPGNSCKALMTSLSPNRAGTFFSCITGNSMALIWVPFTLLSMARAVTVTSFSWFDWFKAMLMTVSCRRSKTAS